MSSVTIQRSESSHESSSEESENFYGMLFTGYGLCLFCIIRDILGCCNCWWFKWSL